ncbi:MAG: acyltransferase family protein [Coprococcus sp.]
MERKISVKNGKIEFYRFICCLYVLLFHVEKYILGEASLKEGIHPAFFPHGSMGVEFFFILSGFFLAQSVYKQYQNTDVNLVSDQVLSKEYLVFMKNKYLRIFPQHFIAFILTFIVFCIVNRVNIKGILLLLYDSVPNLFLFQMAGISFKNINHVEWYISCMLIAMAIIYPLCRKWYYQFTRFFAPLLCLLLCGYMIYTTGALTGVSVWMGIAYKSLFRAIAEVAIGTTAFEMSRCLTEYLKTNCSKQTRIGLTAVEVLSFLYLTFYVVFTIEKKYEVYIIPAVLLMIVIGYCGISYGSSLFNCKLFYFLGELSFPVYLGQVAAIYIIQSYAKDIISGCIGIVVLTFVFAMIIMMVDKLWKRKKIVR